MQKMETNKRIFKIGSRTSQLAMWQTEFIISELRRVSPKNEFVIVPIETKGDKILDVSLSKIGDKGLFTEALETAMLNHQIDMAVHSLKDMPTKLSEGLTLSGFTKRHDPSDAWVSKDNISIENLPKAAIVGTSSLRRVAQIKKIRPDLIIKDIRGNVGTRLKRLNEEDFSAIILATAGLERLGLDSVITKRFNVDEFIPAVSQGVIAVEARIDDTETIALLEKIEDKNSKYAILAERSFLRTLEGGCQAPIGAHAKIEDRVINLHGFVSSLNGDEFIEITGSGNIEFAEELGEKLAREILDLGAEKILKSME